MLSKDPIFVIICHTDNNNWNTMTANQAKQFYDIHLQQNESHEICIKNLKTGITIRGLSPDQYQKKIEAIKLV